MVYSEGEKKNKKKSFFSGGGVFFFLTLDFLLHIKKQVVSSRSVEK